MNTNKNARSPSLRDEILSFVLDNYGTEPEYPWESAPTYAVLRHSGNGKWYGLIMNIPYRKLGIDRDGETDIINVKFDHQNDVLLLEEHGIFPAYHMNKTHWISVLLDKSVDISFVTALLGKSHRMTAPRLKKARQK